MSEVAFFITGLSLCKPQVSADRGLEVLFIHPLTSTEEKHTLIVTIRKGPPEMREKPIIRRWSFERKTKFSVVLDNTVALPSDGLPSFNDLVNFDSYYDRSLRLSYNHNVEVSYLSIPHTQPFTALHDDDLYDVFEVSSSTESRPIPPPLRVGKTMGTTFRINDAVPGGNPAGSLTLRAQGATRTEEKLEFEAGMAYEIEFDNHDVFHQPSEKNDYHLYYHVLDGRNSDGRKLTIILDKHPIVTDQQACNISKGGGDCDFLRFFETGTCQ
jgi:hypothetical protein